MHYRSRTRGLWHKGATSGHVQTVVSLTPDCDGDAVLARVTPAGPACHRGTVSCFETDPPGPSPDVLAELDAIIAARQAEPAGDTPSYTRTLLADRNRRLKKLGEESAELVMACADEDRPRAVEEAADVIYHLLVAVRAVGGSWAEVRGALAARRR